MGGSTPAGLSRRERQVMDFLYERGRATAAELTAGLPDAPSNSAVRALLRSLEAKGHVVHAEEGRAYVYQPVVPRERARRSALTHLVRTFFGGSVEDAAAALLDLRGERLPPETVRRLRELIERAGREGR
jgi:BlaI family transcriptional regulator, penicillinase repressor